MERTLVKLFVSVIVILLVLTVSLNVFINPYGYYGEKQQKVFVFNDCQSKINYVTNLKTKPEAFVFGTSNSLGMQTSAIEKWTGYSTFNFGIYYATAEDFYCITHAIVQANCHPKLALFFLDDYSFQDIPAAPEEIFPGANNRLATSPALAKFLPGYSKAKLLWGQLSLALSLDQTNISLSCFAKKLSHFNFSYESNKLTDIQTSNGERVKFFDNNIVDGVDLIDLLDKGKLDVEPAIKKEHEFYLKDPQFPMGIISYHPSHIDFKDFSARRIMLFENTLKYLDSINCKIIITIMPYQPYFQSLLRKYTNYDERIQRLYTILKEDQKKYPHIILVKDNHLIENFGGYANQFYDSHHVSKINSSLILESLENAIPKDALQ